VRKVGLRQTEKGGEKGGGGPRKEERRKSLSQILGQEAPAKGKEKSPQKEGKKKGDYLG